MDQAFARPGLGHVEGLDLSRDLARVVVDAGLVLLWNVDHFDNCSGCKVIFLVLSWFINITSCCAVSIQCI